MIVLRREPPVAWVTLARPEVRNALDAALIAEIHRTFETLAGDDEIRVAILAGEGKAFSVGADIKWMRDSLELSKEENLEEARRLSRMLRAIDRLPKLVIGRVHGAALGGGAGLAAVCDVVVAEEETIFGFTEARLGLLPAVISPFVIAKIGRSHARALCLTADRFDAKHALRIGLVHEIANEWALDAAVERFVAAALEAAPGALAATKALLRTVAEHAYDDTLELTAGAIAAQRVSPEGQEGLRAFLERRPPAWRP